MEGYGPGPYMSMPTAAAGLGHEAMGMAHGAGVMPGDGQEAMAAAYMNGPGMYLDGLRAYAPQHTRGVHVPVVDPGPPIKMRDVDRGPEGCNLFIFHVPNDLTNIALYRLFAPFGPMLSARIMVDKRTGCSRGFGFVSYENHESAANAIKCMNGFQLGHKRLKVELKKEKGARGGDMGRPHNPADDPQHYMSPGMGAAYMHAGRQMDPALAYHGADGASMAMYGNRGHAGQAGMDNAVMMGMMGENAYYSGQVDLARKGFPAGPMMSSKMAYPMEAMMGRETSPGMWPVDVAGHPMAPPVAPLVMKDQNGGAVQVDPALVEQMGHMGHMGPFAMPPPHYSGYPYPAMLAQRHPGVGSPTAPINPGAAKGAPGPIRQDRPTSAAPVSSSASSGDTATTAESAVSSDAPATSPQTTSPRDHAGAPSKDQNLRQLWSKSGAPHASATTAAPAAKPEPSPEREDPAKDLDKLVESNLRI